MTRMVLLLLVLLFLVTPGQLLSPQTAGQSQASRRLPPCDICRTLVSSFEEGLLRTSKGTFTGGDVAWEEENKKSYKHSDLRLTEIQEGLCAEVVIGKDHCHEFGVNNEEFLEEWWAERRLTLASDYDNDLYSWLCVSKLEVCCPADTYGPQCLPCPGTPGAVCSNHGKCKGSGTRRGTGECSCDPGYEGKFCDSCAALYYPRTPDPSNLSCGACHKACKNSCSGSGAKNCESCKEGWEADEEAGCVDANECLREVMPCKISEFCHNIEGSYLCLNCDTACEGCYGDGPDMCIRCAEDHIMVEKVCIDNRVMGGRKVQLVTTRYAIYTGLFMICYFLLKNNALTALIAAAFAAYIGLTEYLLSGKV